MSQVLLKDHPDIEIIAKPHARAKRITLRRSVRLGGFTLTHPPRTSQKQLESFVADNLSWLLQHHQPSDKIEIGGKVSIFGTDYSIVKGEKRGVRIVGDELHVASTNPARAIGAFLKSLAALYAPSRLDHYTNALGTYATETRWRDPKSRWGSCDHRGRIMLSWRLVMAPEFVFDYVIAHEAAHLVHMNHSQAYWDCLAGIYPEITKAKSWLRQNGQKLQSLHFA